MRHDRRAPQPPPRVAGFTIVECMVVSVLFAIIGTLGLQWFTSISDFWEVSTTQSELRSQSAQALELMKQELHRATRASPTTPPSLTIPAAPNNTQITFYLPVDADGNGTIVDATGNIEWNPPCVPPNPCDPPTPVTYAFNAATGRITRTAGATQRIIATEVTTAAFIDRTIDATLYANELRLTLTMQRVTPHNRTITTTGTIRVELKN